MNLYTIIMVEPLSQIPVGTIVGEELFLTLGGLPGGETSGPWHEKQINIVNDAVNKWHQNVPELATKLHQSQRNATLGSVSIKNYCFTFNFNTGDEIDLDCYFDDTSSLFKTLKMACEGTDMVATKFDSI